MLEKIRKNFLKRVGYGLIVWLVPYVASLPLLDLAHSDPNTFKSLMIIIGSINSSALAVLYFKDIRDDYFTESFILGITWLLISWALDMLGVVPFTHQTTLQYFLQIGFEYIGLMTPILAIGYLLNVKTQK